MDSKLNLDLAAAIGLVQTDCFFLTANWPVPDNVRTLLTTRKGGVSNGYFQSLNVGDHVGDDPQKVIENRRIVEEKAGKKLVYLNQIHSDIVVNAFENQSIKAESDASDDRSGQVACAVMTADCLPVLLCDDKGTVVAAAHAGWRGLAGGVLQNTISAMGVAPESLLAYLGPAIGPDAFEVGQNVWDAFCLPIAQAEQAFEAIGDGKYLADIYMLARLILQREGVNQIFGGEHCTVLERDTFFSYRRDGQTGRMVSAIWLENNE